MKIPLYKKSTVILTYSMVAILIIGFAIGAIFTYRAAVKIDFYLSITGIIIFLIAICTDIKAGTMSSTIEINENGITYESKTKKYHIKWEDIQFAGVTKYGIKSRRRIFFSTNFSVHLIKANLQPSLMSNQLIFVFNREGLLKQIRKYWDGTIVGEEIIL